MRFGRPTQWPQLSASKPRRSGALKYASFVAIFGLFAGLGVVLPAPAMAGSAFSMTLEGLQSDLCAGGGAEVKVTDNITATTSVLNITNDCVATLDLNGKEVRVRSVVLGTGADLTVMDSASGGKLTADGSGNNNTAGIQTTGATLRIEGGEVTAKGGRQAAGIGGGGESSDGGTVTISGGTVTAQGGTYGAGIGGGDDADGGTVTISGGTVTAAGGTEGAGIGGGGAGTAGLGSGNGGTVRIEGGVVTATGGRNGAGIGGGQEGNGGDVTISDGVVTAKGGSNAAGIGGGDFLGHGGNVTISGGQVSATGGYRGAGIGGGRSANGGTVTISGGEVTATGGTDAAGIGGGYEGNGGTVTVSAGEVTATGGNLGAGIGGGRREFSNGGAGGNVTISGGQVSATGGTDAAGIGGGYEGNGGTVTILGGEVTATAGSDTAQPIGPGKGGNAGTIEVGESANDTITGLVRSISFPVAVTSFADLEAALCNDAVVQVTDDITATTSVLNIANNCVAKLDLNGKKVQVRSVVLGTGADLTIMDSAGEGKLIADGSGNDNTAGIQTTGATLQIEGGTVTAQGGDRGAGIGGGEGGNAGSVTISGGTVTAQGGNRGAGIGGGRLGAGGTVTISGGEVTAQGGDRGAGIGGGRSGAGGDVAILGGTVTAQGGTYGAGIGGAGIGDGMEGAGGDVTISGGEVTAQGGTYGAGIGGGRSGAGGDVTISGGEVTAQGGDRGAGIGGGEQGAGGTVTISGGEVTAEGGNRGAGIGGGEQGAGGPVTIEGGVVTATGGTDAAGIGGGEQGAGGPVTIEGGTVTATAGSGTAQPIGRGTGGTGGTLTLGPQPNDSTNGLVRSISFRAPTIDAGGGESATVGTAVATPPSVLVRDENDNPVEGVTVSFTGDGTVSPAEVVTNASGIATVESWILGTTAGAQTLTATVGALSVEFTATGQRITPTITITNPGTKNSFSDDFPLEVLVTQPGEESLTYASPSLSYSATPVDVCSVSPSGVVSLISSGNCTITVTSAQTDQYDQVTESVTFTVEPVSQTLVFTTDAPTGSNAEPGQTYTPTVSSTREGDDVDTGLAVSLAVTGDEGVCSVDGGTVTFLAAGDCVIEATQDGDGRYSPAATVHQTVTVQRITPELTVTNPGIKTPFTEEFTLEVNRVLPWPGTLDNKPTDPGLEFAVTAGAAHCSVDAEGLVSTAGKTTGECTITVTSVETGQYAAVSTTVSFDIKPVVVVQGFLSGKTPVFGETDTLVIDVNQSRLQATRFCGVGVNVGLVAFADFDRIDKSQSGSVFLTFNKAGECRVEFTIEGVAPDDFLFTHTFTVHKAAHTIVVDTPAPTGDDALTGMTYTPTVSSTRDHDDEPTGLTIPLGIDTGSTAVCEMDGDGVITFLQAGECVITADKGETDNYLAASTTQTVVVTASVGAAKTLEPGGSVNFLADLERLGDLVTHIAVVDDDDNYVIECSAVTGTHWADSDLYYEELALVLYSGSWSDDNLVLTIRGSRDSDCEGIVFERDITLTGLNTQLSVTPVGPVPLDGEAVVSWALLDNNSPVKGVSSYKFGEEAVAPYVTVTTVSEFYGLWCVAVHWANGTVDTGNAGFLFPLTITSDQALNRGVTGESADVDVFLFSVPVGSPGLEGSCAGVAPDADDVWDFGPVAFTTVEFDLLDTPTSGSGVDLDGGGRDGGGGDVGGRDSEPDPPPVDSDPGTAPAPDSIPTPPSDTTSGPSGSTETSGDTAGGEPQADQLPTPGAPAPSVEPPTVAGSPEAADEGPATTDDAIGVAPGGLTPPGDQTDDPGGSLTPAPSTEASRGVWEGSVILGFGIVAVALLLGLGLLSLGAMGVFSGAGGSSRFSLPTAR